MWPKRDPHSQTYSRPPTTTPMFPMSLCGSKNRHKLAYVNVVQKQTHPRLCSLCLYVVQKNRPKLAYVNVVQKQTQPRLCSLCSYVVQKNRPKLAYVNVVQKQTQPRLCSLCSYVVQAFDQLSPI